MQSSLPAGWLAFTGRESNPLDHYKRFQITLSSPSSGFILAQRTAGFPRYGWKAGVSGGAFPRINQLKPAPGMHWLMFGLRPLPSSMMKLRRNGPRLARENVACRTEVACSHVSGLFTQSGGTAGPDGVREPRPHHSSGIDVPMNRQASLGCVGSTDCAITRHCSLASSSPSAVGD